MYLLSTNFKALHPDFKNSEPTGNHESSSKFKKTTRITGLPPTTVINKTNNRIDPLPHPSLLPQANILQNNEVTDSD